jgi:glycosyltransferase involved in cell wall biosynthesis
MKILISSHAFPPDVGGLETVARVLADTFTALGNEVRVVTQSLAPEQDPAAFAYPVYRRPDAKTLWRQVRWCDILFQNNISLGSLWPALILRRPWVAAQQMWLTRVGGAQGWQDWLKRQVIRRGAATAISRAIAKELPIPATLIGNPYEMEQFRLLPEVPRARDLVFLARLVSDKGGDVLFDALAALKKEGLMPNLTVIGDGPEAGNLRRQAEALCVADQIDFAGKMTGEPLARALNAHEIMVVPSRLPEPFGVVALEGIACGCALIGSAEGGLPDAIGPCGILFPNGDAGALAQGIKRLMLDAGLRGSLRAEAAAHLAKHTPRGIAEAYLAVFRRVLSE